MLCLLDSICVIKEDHGVQEIVAKASGKPVSNSDHFMYITLTLFSILLQMKKRELSVVDDSQKQVRLTLWGKTAEDFDSSGYPVVAFKGLRVNDFNGRSLSLSQAGTFKVNPDIPEKARLKHWYVNFGNNPFPLKMKLIVCIILGSTLKEMMFHLIPLTEEVVKVVSSSLLNV